MFELPVVPAPACAHARSCPISHTPCPGECIYADIMQSVHLGVAVFDLDARALLFINRAGEGYFTRQRLQPDFELLRHLMFPPGLPVDSLPVEYAGEPLLLDTRLIGYTLYRSGHLAWAFFRDITEKTRLETIAEAAETMNNIGSIFSAVRHELGNPINSVKAALSVLRANFDTFSRESVLDYLEQMGNELGRVEVLLRSLRSFSMYEQLEPVAVELRPFLESFATLARVDLQRRGIRLSLAHPTECVALADPRALRQALINLVANAADAAEGVSDPEITLSSACVDGLARLSVEDNGVGMNAEQLSAAFKPFHTTKAQGTGLGLVISRKLLLKMGGTVTLDSRQGQGTRVHLALPVAP
ncbi:MAG: HAMP domain-containing sensor histidine kinase [Archangium sp.]|nr:HAMP domain-containing sensor histidine kinase [Archangium sp.]